MPLESFKHEMLDLLLQFLWRQWSALGVAGQSECDDSWVIDPEALLLFSATITRYDQRLFDEILDWVVCNERFINVQRLKQLLKTENFSSGQVLTAIAKHVVREKSAPSWKKLARSDHADSKEQALFYLKTGKPMPVVGDKDEPFLTCGFARNPVQLRKLSKPFSKNTIPALLLQLRGLMGTNSRAEILLYLLINEQGTIQEIADQTGYAWRSVQDVLFEMGHSPVIHFPETKKGRVYYIHSKPWQDMFSIDRLNKIQWICWPPLFRALELIWLKLQDAEFVNLSTLEQAAEIKRMMDSEVIPRLTKAGFGSELHKISGVWGEQYLDDWLKVMKAVLERLSRTGG